MASVPVNDMYEATGAGGFVASSTRVGWQVKLAMLALATLAGFLGQFASFMLWIEPSRLTFAWVPGGLLLALLLLRPRREWLVWVCGIMAGGAAALMWRGTPAVFAFGAYAPSMLGTSLAALYLRRQPMGVFASAASFSRFFVVSTIVLPAVIGWTFSFVADLSGLRPGVFANWQMLAPAYAMGSLLITTPALACVNWRSSISALGAGRLATMAESALIGIALLLLSMGLWVLVPSSASVLPLLLFAPVPLMMLAAIRFGSPGAATALVLVAIPAAWVGIYGDGRMRMDTSQMNAHIVQLWLLAVGFLVHVLAILSRQYESVRLLLNASNRHARSLAGRLLQGQEEERARIARELHDGINQQIASLAIAVSSLKRRSAEPDRSGLDELHLSMIHLSEEVRRISHNLHPSLLEHVGLGPALDSMVQMKAEQWDGQIHYEWEPGAARSPAGTTVCLYRIAQEALCNAIRHADARHIRIQFESMEDECLLVVEDDGCGFDLERVHRAGGLGLLSMQERAALQGGCMRIVSSPGAGTQIRVSVPREAPAWP